MKNLSVKLKIRYNGLENAKLVSDDEIRYNCERDLDLIFIPNEYLRLCGGLRNGSVILYNKISFCGKFRSYLLYKRE